MKEATCKDALQVPPHQPVQEMHEFPVAFFRYVPLSRIAAYRAIGWGDETPLGPYSVLMRWMGAGEPVEQDSD